LETVCKNQRFGRPRRQINAEQTNSLGKPIGKDSSLKTWSGHHWKIGGGTTWGWFVYDPQLDLFYFGTGFSHRALQEDAPIAANPD
jgi:glucose dehydrogenase